MFKSSPDLEFWNVESTECGMEQNTNSESKSKSKADFNHFMF